LFSPKRNPKDFWTGAIYVAFGAAFVLIAQDYGMGTAFRMGPAYFPTVLGGILVLIGLISVGRSFLKPGTQISAYTIKGLVTVVGSTLVFGFIVRGAGLAVALPILVLMTGYASIDFRWGRMIALAAGITVFCVLIFVKGLGVPLPVIGPWLGGG
jgi:Tripartite tricarboxylate transporter TctB family